MHVFKTLTQAETHMVKLCTAVAMDASGGCQGMLDDYFAQSRWNTDDASWWGPAIMHEYVVEGNEPNPEWGTNGWAVPVEGGYHLYVNKWWVAEPVVEGAMLVGFGVVELGGNPLLEWAHDDANLPWSDRGRDLRARR